MLLYLRIGVNIFHSISHNALFSDNTHWFESECWLQNPAGEDLWTKYQVQSPLQGHLKFDLFFKAKEALQHCLYCHLRLQCCNKGQQSKKSFLNVDISMHNSSLYRRPVLAHPWWCPAQNLTLLTTRLTAREEKEIS